MSHYLIEHLQEALGDRFTDFKLLGAGGFGAVYSVWDYTRRDRVALKLMKAQRDRSWYHRFRNEYLILLQGGHPALVAVFDMGECKIRSSDGQLVDHFWYTMECCSSSVRMVLKTLSLDKRIDISLQALSVISFLHANDIAHRDIKPENLFVTHEGKVKIGDFGIAKQSKVVDPVTPPDIVMGDFRYLAPERWGRPGFEWRPSDQYAAGATVYEVLSQGREPLDFEGRTPQDFLRAHQSMNMRPINIPERLGRALPVIDKVLRRMMAKNPDERYHKINDAREELITALLHYNLYNESPSK